MVFIEEGGVVNSHPAFFWFKKERKYVNTEERKEDI